MTCECSTHLRRKSDPQLPQGPTRQDGFMDDPLPQAYRWIKTECGRAKYAELAAQQGLLARLRLAWFVLIAAMRDWRLQ